MKTKTESRKQKKGNKSYPPPEERSKAPSTAESSKGVMVTPPFKLAFSNDWKVSPVIGDGQLGSEARERRREEDEEAAAACGT